MDRTEARKLIAADIEELLSIADDVRKKNIGQHMEVCGIVNAKSGICSEDCKFCAQSAHYCTDVPEYPLKDATDIIEAAKLAKANGAGKFGIVTSGNRLTPEEIDIIADAIREIKDTIDISPCASLGALNEGSFAKLKDAGLTRYHHNIETSERFYTKIVSTHNYSERVATIKNAKNTGLEVCSGGIFGLGENWDDRIDMAFLLRELDIDSVPMNFLVPIKGTPMENTEPIDPMDAIRTIALFRIILPGKTIKVVAGREAVLKNMQDMMFRAGANGMMVGGYLTIPGRLLEDDLVLIRNIKESWKND